MALEDATAATPLFTLAGTVRRAKVVSCYDGDSFEAVMDLDGKLWRFDCRMLGYDSPEMKPLKTAANREAEKVAALRAKIALLSFLCDGVDIVVSYSNKMLDECVKQNKKIVLLNCKEFDKYGRVLVEVGIPSTPADGANTVNNWMITNKFGYAYSGGTKKVYMLSAV